jgi:phosphoribosylaminoimidazole-succinocarboxamide synthase
MPELLHSDLPFPCRRGKVRDVYDLGDSLLIVATDRISAFDVIMPNGIPDKGKMLTAISCFWFNHFASEFENHLIAADADRFPTNLQMFSEQLRGRSMLVKKAAVIPFECVARGYLAGSGWKEYRSTGQICGVQLPPNLQQCGKLPQTLFTPATKAESGHDENVSFDKMADAIGLDRAEQLREKTIQLYTAAADYALERGVIIADTKFEFGLFENRIILIDEVLTPDSSRFWPRDSYAPGRDQPSFDKQFVRNWLESQPWNKTPPAPPHPKEIVQGTRERYTEACERLIGKKFTA